MAEGDSTPPRVDLGMVETKNIYTVYGHTGKSFVDFKDIDILYSQLKSLKELWDGGGRANAHDSRRYASNGSTAELAQDRLAEFPSLGSFHHKKTNGYKSIFSPRSNISLS